MPLWLHLMLFGLSRAARWLRGKKTYLMLYGAATTEVLFELGRLPASTYTTLLRLFIFGAVLTFVAKVNRAIDSARRTNNLLTRR